MKKLPAKSRWGGALLALVFSAAACASGGAVSPEEYYSLGVAYMDLGKYDEAEKWFERAEAFDKTRNAARYNLGRVAFETGRYAEAAEIFESLLRRDPSNVTTLKAAAYASIRNGDMEKALAHYEKILSLVPPDADDGYNYALVLLATGKADEAETEILKYSFALLENPDLLLLYARVQRAQGKVEAVDTYASYLADHNDPLVRYEYALSLEKAELYARALEQYDDILSSASGDPGTSLSRLDVRFARSRLLLIADSQSDEGLTGLRALLDEGYKAEDKFNALLEDSLITTSQKESIQTMIRSRSERPAESSAEESVEERSEHDVERSAESTNE
ncbi:MAG: tetratricopeptide repeat protein [Spirochaetaceae bacterium]|jgi:tetratricopeptide (TPR) repeat protein|nr:tetratricopeptide repeat protein [Spirochaetaceae bacterium]